MDHTGSHFVMLERNKFRKVGQPWNLCHREHFSDFRTRCDIMCLEFQLSMDMIMSYMWIVPLTHHLKVWTGIVTVLLMYIGTWFLFQLTFIDLHKPEPMQALWHLGRFAHFH